MSGYKRADGPHDPAPWSYRVEVILCCPSRRKLVAFHASTEPGRLAEPVMYDVRRHGTLTGTGEDWGQMEVGCTHCAYHVPVSRKRIEAYIGSLRTKWATHRESVVWDAQSR